MNDLVKKEDQPLITESVSEIVKIDYVAMAIEKGADLATIEKFMDLKERQDATEAKKAYITAMGRFRSECPAIIKNKKAHNAMYAGLGETIQQIQGLLSECGLSHSWKTNQEDSLTSVQCCVTHVLGHEECTSLSAASDTSGSKNAIQAMGSTVSYLQRYTLFSILGLASQEMDNDGGAPIEYITEEMANILDAKIEENEIDRKKFNSWLKRDLKVDSLEGVSMAAYKTVDSRINSAIRAKKKEGEI